METNYTGDGSSMQDFTTDQPADNNSNGQNKSSNQRQSHGVPLQGRRSRIRYHPYKGIGSRTYKNTVFVSNIPYELSEEEFKELFEKEVGKISFCEIFPEKGGLSTGCGSIEFENPEDVEKAIVHMRKHQIQGRGLVIRDDRDLSYSSRYRPPQPVKYHHNSSTTAPEVLLRLGIHPEEVSETVHVAQLAEEVDLRKLKDVFSLAGVVMNLDILKDDQGTSLGLATVTFSSSEEAINAISMLDSKELFEKKMSVRMDKGKKRALDSANQVELPAGLGEIGTNLLSRTSRGVGGAGPSLMGLSMGGGGGGGGFGGRMGGGFDRPMERDMGYGYGIGSDMSGYHDYYPSESRGGFGGGPMRGYDHDSYRGSGSHGGLGSDMPPGSQVFVRNLTEGTTWEDLKDEFKKIGPVYFADIKKDNAGNSRCMGTVKFFNPQHAQQAILLMNGAVLNGRRIGVTVGRY